MNAPGGFLWEVICRAGLNVSNAAKVLGVTRPALTALLNGWPRVKTGRAGFSPEMAAKFIVAFPQEEIGIRQHYLMQYTENLDRAVEKRRAKKNV